MTSLKPKQVGVLVGSLRRGSFSRKLAKALIARAPAGLDCKIIEIADLSRRENISLEYINGKPARLLEISTASDPATFFPPSGDRIQGAAKVSAANKKGAKAFAAGSTGRFEVLQSGSSGGFGFWTGVHHAKVVMPGKDKPVPMQLRTTEVFRAEDGAWKLVHRHADMAEAKK